MQLRWITAVVAALVVAGSTPAAAERTSRRGHVTIEDASGRPDMATGGDVLVSVTGVSTSERSDARFELDGRPATDVTRSPRLGQWLVGGMRPGRHRITVRTGNGDATLRVTDYPITGPVFSGPHLPLAVCTTRELGLGAPSDADCSAPTKVETSTRSDGTVVRTEEGVIDRSVYWISMPSHWNGRLVYRYGGGCGTSYAQGTPLAVSTVDDGLLSKGYAVATATFNTFQVQCNDVLSAETTMMVKEHFAKEFGPPRFTIGDGGSGGAIQQLLIAQDYPGLLDAIAPTIPFPDALSISGGVSDCGLIERFRQSPAGTGWTPAQVAAVEGYAVPGSCTLWVSSFLSGIEPFTGCDPGIPAANLYSAANPRGLRCTLADENRNELGVDPATGFANRPLDNVGVQYGVAALRKGVITVDQFLDLNEHIGGYDIDGRPMAARETATTSTLRRVYSTGRILEGGGTTRRMPVLTSNVYTDPRGDIHTRVRSFSIRARLSDAKGHRDPNDVIWTRPSGADFLKGLTGAVGNSTIQTTVLDQWLTTGHAPPLAHDACFDASGATVAIGDHVYDGPGQCTDPYPLFGDPRIAAGATVRNDVLKCRLTKVDFHRYPTPFTADQRARLRRVFPGGVCDWSKPGVGQVPITGTWLRY